MKPASLKNTLVFLSLMPAAAVHAQSKPIALPPTASFVGTRDALDFTKNRELASLTTHAKPIWAISAHKMPSDPPGQWTLCFTVRALKGFGNPGFSGFVMASYRPGATKPLELLHYADGINEAFIDYNLNLEPVTKDAANRQTGGRYAVFDRFQFVNGKLTHTGVFLATRTDDRKNFGKAQQVQGITGTSAMNFADPALGYVDGKLKLFYGALGKDAKNKDVQGIFMDDLLDVSTKPRVAGKPVLVSRSKDAEHFPHSPTPIAGPDGNVRGLFVADANPKTNTSPIYFTVDLDPETPQVLMIPASDWMSSGGILGGTAIFLKGSNQTAPIVFEGTWLTGDRVSNDATASVQIAAHGAPGLAKPTTVAWVGPWLQNPVTVPGVLGQIGILPLIALGVGPVDADQIRSYALSTRGLRGIDLPLQGLSIHRDATKGTVYRWTNTATIRVR